jgi:hypothetical protein
VKPRTVPHAAAEPQGYGNVEECNSFSGDSGIQATGADHFAARDRTLSSCVFHPTLDAALMCNYYGFTLHPTP